MTKREIQADKTKKRIQEEARKLILEKGIDKFTMKDIAKAADVAVGTVYLYYSSKADIQVAFEDEAYLDNFREIMNDSSLTYGQKLYKYNKFWYINGEEMGAAFLRGWYRFSLDKENYANESDGHLESRIEREIKVSEEMLQYGIDSGELDKETPTKELAEILTVSRQGTSMYWALMDGNVSRKHILNEYLYHVLEPALKRYGLKSAIEP